MKLCFQIRPHKLILSLLTDGTGPVAKQILIVKLTSHESVCTFQCSKENAYTWAGSTSILWQCLMRQFHKKFLGFS